ncbi:hypothetical protein [Paenibacillus paridis]|uniref:hypothetical protein n=1 Tax=Paenibacillus paridis TaxID=2583376 RepID=UPI001EE43C03|nr:hypothetical protein [Paenibacillus paridis]
MSIKANRAIETVSFVPAAAEAASQRLLSNNVGWLIPQVNLLNRPIGMSSINLFGCTGFFHDKPLTRGAPNYDNVTAGMLKQALSI